MLSSLIATTMQTSGMTHESISNLPSNIAPQKAISAIPYPIPLFPVRCIAEFEPMDGALITYPLTIPYNLVKEIASDLRIYCITENASAASADFKSKGIKTDSITFLDMAVEAEWTRDFGPWFITTGNTNIAGFDFAYQGAGFVDCDSATRRIGRLLDFPVYGHGIYCSGGNYMSDGYGRGMSTTQVWDKNIELSHQKIDSIMRVYLGLHTFNVVDDPLSTYIDHIDCWAKFCLRIK